MRHLPSQYHCSWPKSMFVLRFHLTFSQTKIIWYVQTDIFTKAAENGDLAQVRKSIAASVPINCRDQVRNYLSLSVTMIITVSSPHIHISLCHSIFFLTLSRKPCRTIIPSLSAFATSYLSLVLSLSFTFRGCATEVPSFSHCLFNHLISFTIYLTLSHWNLRLFLTLLMVSLDNPLPLYIYFSLFDKKNLSMLNQYLSLLRRNWIHGNISNSVVLW